MEKPKFTPGPWVEDGIAIAGNTGEICYMGELAQYAGDEAVPLDNAKANARLITAAPDMYACLKECEVTLRVMGHDSEPLARMAEAARVALSKAEGREGEG